MKVIGRSEKLMIPEKPDGLEQLKTIGIRVFDVILFLCDTAVSLFQVGYYSAFCMLILHKVFLSTIFLSFFVSYLHLYL